MARKAKIRTGGKIFEWKIFNYLRYGITWIVALFLKLWWSTLRVEISEEALAEMKNTTSPLVILFWHNQLFASAHYGKYRTKGRLYALMSAGTIGSWISPFFEHFNTIAIRGSVNLRGKEALKEVIQILKNGNDVIITPDGSRGPRYQFKPGAALAIKTTDPAILFFSCDFQNAWRLDTWDGFYIPKPFSKVECKVRIYSSYKELSDSDDIKDITNALSRELMAITSDNITD